MLTVMKPYVMIQKLERGYRDVYLNFELEHTEHIQVEHIHTIELEVAK